MPAYMPAQKRRDIRDAIQAGMTGADIMRLLTVSAGTVVRVKREMGLPIRPIRQTRTRGPVRAVAQPPEGDPPSNHTSYAEAHIESLYAEQPAPTIPRPEAYVTAFENRVLEYHALLKQKDAAHEQTLLERDGTIERLQKENAKLRDECAQIVFQQQNWTGPTSTMTQSLGNGG